MSSLGSKRAHHLTEEALEEVWDTQSQLKERLMLKNELPRKITRVVR
jgi:hypothetical protein